MREWVGVPSGTLCRTRLTIPLPSSASVASRRELERAGGKRPPERINEPGIEEIGTESQAPRKIGLAPFRSAPGLSTKLACFGNNATSVSRAGHGVAPGNGSIAGCPGEHEALITIEDRHQVKVVITGEPLGVSNCASHRFSQCFEVTKDQWRSAPGHQIRGFPAQKRQRKGKAGIDVIA